MNAGPHPPNPRPKRQIPPDWYADFQTLKEHYQALDAELADWNRRKNILSKPRHWRKKRQLVPPALQTRPVRRAGAQPGNTNRLKHGNFGRETQLLYALVRAHIHAGRALVDEVRALHTNR